MGNSHPSRSPRLYALAATALGMGLVGLVCAGNLDYELRDLAPFVVGLAGVAFTLCLILCAAAAYAWVLRGHAVWRESGGLAEEVAQAKASARRDAEERAAWEHYQRTKDAPAPAGGAVPAVESLRNAAPAAGGAEPEAGSARMM